MNVEKIAFGGWDNCYRLSNDQMAVIVTTDVGPRIIYCGLKDGDNLLHTVADDLGKTGGATWRMYGGHRLWHSPEVMPRTYQADNDPVQYFASDDGHYFVPPIEHATGIQKQIRLSFSGDTLVIDHTFTNKGMWAIDIAPWALTVMDAGGVAMMPLPPYASHDTQLLPTHALTLWSYTSLSDPRLQFSDKYICLEQHTDKDPLKIGLQASHEYLSSVAWLAYLNDSTLFVKSFQPPLAEAMYPDMGTQLELFTNKSMLELETIGAVQHLRPDETLTHREYWSIHANVTIPQDSAQIQQTILPLVRASHPVIG